MANSTSFIDRLKAIVYENYSNERFGVSELVGIYGVSRSQLHKKLKKELGKSISQFIREIRLEESLKLLQETDYTVSEIAYKVGFNSPTYFNTCFREFYGCPPGEIKLRRPEGTKETIPIEPLPQNIFLGPQHSSSPTMKKVYKQRIGALFALSIAFILAIGLLIFFRIADETGEDFSKGELVENSIAVLPFDDLSPKRDQEPFSNAMVVEINNRLVKIKELLVTSRNSTLSYKGSLKPTREIAKELGVTCVLLGSIQKNSETVRISVQLVDGKSDKIIWSDDYNVKIDSVFAVQSKIAQQVANELRVYIPPNVRQRIAKPPTQNIKAYSLYLQVDTNNTLEENVTLLKEAIQLDPFFADAYVQMAIEKLWRITAVRAYVPQNLQEYLLEIKGLLNKGLELDPDNASAHLFLGALNLWFNWDFKNAETSYLKAMDLNPGLPYSTYTEFLLSSGRFEEALQNSFSFIKSNPNDTFAWNSQGLCYSYLNNQQMASESIRIGEEKDALHPYSDSQVLHLLNYQEKYEEVISRYEKLSDSILTFPHILSMAAIAYGQLGDKAQVDDILKRLKLLSSESSIGSPNYYIAMVYAQTGEIDLAFEWLEKGLLNHDVEMYWLKVEPFFMPLNTDPRWSEILKTVGF